MNNTQNSDQGMTGIDELLRMGENSNIDNSTVDSIMAEISQEKKNEELVQATQQQQQNNQNHIQQQQQQEQHRQMNAHIQSQQLAIENLVKQNKYKDNILSQLKNNNNDNNGNNDMDNKLDDKISTKYDLLSEFKPTLILFSIIIVLTLPVINTFICKSIGIEADNTIFSILRCFIISVIFFLMNKFIN